MKLGGWGRLPLRMGGGLSYAESAYLSMKAARGVGAYSQDDNTIANRELACVARAMGRAQSWQARGANQAQLAKVTDLLREQEARFGVVPNQGDTDSQRRGVLQAVVHGNGVPSGENIAAALRTALGDPCAVLTAIAPAAAVGPTAVSALVVAPIAGGGVLTAGTHYVTWAFEGADGTIYPGSTLHTVSVPSSGYGLAIAALSLPAGIVAVRYYLSVKSGSLSMAQAVRGDGGAVVLSSYPGNAARGGMHRIVVLIPSLTPQRIAKVHKILGPMLSAWTTYSVAETSGFILGTSLLGTGAL